MERESRSSPTDFQRETVCIAMTKIQQSTHREETTRRGAAAGGGDLRREREQHDEVRRGTLGVEARKETRVSPKRLRRSDRQYEVTLAEKES